MKLIFAALVAPFFAAPVFAQDFNYKCNSYWENGYEGLHFTMTLSINREQASGDIIEDSWDDDNGLGGPLDPTYKPRGSSGNVRYGNLIVEKSMVTGGHPLKNGKLGGFVRVEGQAEGGFYQYKFVCNLQP